MRKLTKQQIGNHEAEHGVAKELHRLVVEDAARGILVGLRSMRQRVLQQSQILEAIANGALERAETVAQANRARADGILMRCDQIARHLRLRLFDTDAQLPLPRD